MKWSEVLGLDRTSDDAYSLFLRTLQYMADHKTHGVLRHEAVAACYRAGPLSFVAHREAVAELVVRDVWCETGAGFLLEDWEWYVTEFLPLTAEGEARR